MWRVQKPRSRSGDILAGCSATDHQKRTQLAETRTPPGRGGRTRRGFASADHGQHRLGHLHVSDSSGWRTRTVGVQVHGSSKA